MAKILKKKTKKAEPDLKAEIDKTVKMFDVAKPGNTPAQPTSRPIIVSHGSMIKKDPMVKDEEEPEPEKEIIKTKAGETVITPIKVTEESAEEIPSEPKAAPEPEKPEEDVKPPEEPEEAAKKPEEEKPAEEVKEEISEPKPEKTTEKALEEPEAPEKAKDKEEQKQKDELAAKLKEAEKSIESKEFFVNIGKVSRRRSKNRLLLILIFVLLAGAAFLNFAVDADIIEIGIKPFTDLL